MALRHSRSLATSTPCQLVCGDTKPETCFTCFQLASSPYFILYVRVLYILRGGSTDEVDSFIYVMLAYMWRHGIHSFLDLFRFWLSDSLDGMLAFVYLAYSTIALPVESAALYEFNPPVCGVPASSASSIYSDIGAPTPWTICWHSCTSYSLGRLFRRQRNYSMATGKGDLREREIWTGCVKIWYEKSTDKSPVLGRIQHHLAVFTRPNIVQHLFLLCGTEEAPAWYEFF